MVGGAGGRLLRLFTGRLLLHALVSPRGDPLSSLGRREAAGDSPGPAPPGYVPGPTWGPERRGGWEVREGTWSPQDLFRMHTGVLVAPHCDVQVQVFRVETAKGADARLVCGVIMRQG